jgi:hypothetical protein
MTLLSTVRTSNANLLSFGSALIARLIDSDIARSSPLGEASLVDVVTLLSPDEPSPNSIDVQPVNARQTVRIMIFCTICGFCSIRGLNCTQWIILNPALCQPPGPPVARLSCVARPRSSMTSLRSHPYCACNRHKRAHHSKCIPGCTVMADIHSCC